MEKLHNGFTVQTPAGTFPFSTDSMALSGFVKLPRKAAVLDLCSGCGTLGLMLCADFPDCTVTGVELDDTAHRAALQNIQDNDLACRLKSICADVQSIPNFVAPGSFHCCVSNPPYYPGEPSSGTLCAARQGKDFDLPGLFQSAAWALRYGGDFFLVHKPEYLAKLCACAAEVKLEPKRLCLLRHKASGPISLILLQCRKGGKPGLIWEEQSLFDPDGKPTDYYRMLYHL